MRARLLLIAFLLCCSISQAKTNVSEDSLSIRGFHLDLRLQVMKMPALKNFALHLSKQGINTLVMENEVNSDDFSWSKIPIYLTRLKALMNTEPELDKRFKVLNQDVLYTAAMDEESNLRTQKIHNLYNRLSGIK